MTPCHPLFNQNPASASIFFLEKNAFSLAATADIPRATAGDFAPANVYPLSFPAFRDPTAILPAPENGFPAPTGPCRAPKNLLPHSGKPLPAPVADSRRPEAALPAREIGISGKRKHLPSTTLIQYDSSVLGRTRSGTAGLRVPVPG